jgi:hypothetical protein
MANVLLQSCNAHLMANRQLVGILFNFLILLIVII